MKPIRLQLRGFTAFHNEVSVDFRDRRLFAITGPTGAGKSSLLDGMIWALFGKVPKVGKNIGDLVSHGALSAHVRFEFEARGHAYRVARVRPVKGATTARLERLHPSGEPVPLADSVTEVNAHIEHILGIDYETFVKTIILPQGEFSAFLSGDPKEKKDVLSKLLGLEVYRDMMQLANVKASGASTAASLLQEQYDQIEYKSAAALKDLEAHVHSLHQQLLAVTAKQAQLKRLEACADEFAALNQKAESAAQMAAKATADAHQAEQAEHEAAQSLASASAACDSLSKELASLQYDQSAHDLLHQQVAAAEQLVSARSILAVAERSTAEARDAEQRAAAEAEQHSRAATEAATALEAARGALAAAAMPASVAERALEADASAAERVRAEAERKSHEYELRANTLQHLSQGVATLRHDLETADAEVQRATAAAAVAEAKRQQAEAAERAAAADLDAARARLEAARMQDAAAGLLSMLQVGDPCPVCGEPIRDLKPHATANVTAAERALVSAQREHADALGKHTAASNLSAAAHAHADAARSALAGVEERQVAIERELAVASVTAATVDKAAKRASTAAAAEHDRGVAAQRRVEAATQAANRLRISRAQVPHDLLSEVAEHSAVPTHDQVIAIESALLHVIEGHSAAVKATAEATAAADNAATQRVAATAEVTTAEALRESHAAAARKAAQALVALGMPEDAHVTAVRAALEVMDALAARAKEVTTQMHAAQQRQAASTAVLDFATSSCTAAAAAAGVAEAASSKAAAVAHQAQTAFETEWKLQLPPEHDPNVAAVPDLIAAATQRAQDLAKAVGQAEAVLKAAQDDVAKAEQLLVEVDGYKRRAAIAKDLGLELKANHFVEYIQREAMGMLAADAGERMLQLSRDRYRLEADSNEFMVVDRLNGDERRPVRTLSGGETFLASLALALSLSKRLPELSGHGGALSLESLFLDEGFGSLDAESLDVAIEGLELLATGSRMIGVISHVPEVAERLPDRIEVVKAGGVSTVRDGR